MLKRFFTDCKSDADSANFHPFSLDSASATAVLHDWENDQSFGCFVGSTLAGFSMLRGFDEGFEIPSFGMIIHPAHRGQGLGREFFEWTMQTCESAGAPAVRLSVYADNKPAVRIYQSCGFQVSERLVLEEGREKLVMNRTFR